MNLHLAGISSGHENKQHNNRGYPIISILLFGNGFQNETKTILQRYSTNKY